MIETAEGTWSLGQQAIARNWPALLNDFRSSGNRILVPQERFGRSFKSWGELEMEPYVWKYLARRLAHLEVQCPHKYSPFISEPDPHNEVLGLLEQAKSYYFNDDIPSCLKVLEDGLRLVLRICQVLGSSGGRGIGSRLYVEIIETVRLYAPTVAALDAELGLGWLFMLFESVFLMTGRDVNTLKALWNTLDPPHQQRFFVEAVDMFQQDQNFLAYYIIKLFGN
jgi:hypothetical protein